ncbi:solute carrier organic anion transporter family member 74D [Drosophila tropicalis]|uniref:solute carrier organic anion transporter family member 74D n=1 Tax=Drosophila tropicalis TaxID=46794 RepID=UPI0035ABF331
MMKSNGDIEGHQLPIAPGGASVASVGGQTTKPSNGHSNGHGHGNGNANGNGNGNAYHQNGGGGRRDSSQAFTPLLAQHNNTNGDSLASPATATPTANTMLYESAPSNNNEWKASEDINNLKNGLLSNNNGNGHGHGHGHGHNLREKYNHEQAPLTGGYKLPPARSSESDESDFDSDLNGGANEGSNCGLFGCRPRWARRFASTHVFMVVFLLAYILQGMYMTYFVSVITTIEKLFQIKSKTTGFLLSASEMGQICTAMLLTYFAGRGHRPRWIACGMVLFSIAAFACALPHFIFGEQLMHSSVILQQQQQQQQQQQPSLMQQQEEITSSSSSLMALTQPNPNLCLLGGNGTLAGSECNEQRQQEQASHSKITVIVLCIFFGSLLSSGIGQTAVATLGIPYIDDNVGSKQSPMYMAVTIGMRILGPASGFIFGSFCTRWYVNFTNPGFDASDPRWIGAWWVGPVAIGSLMLMASIAMFSFPKQLSGKKASQSAQAQTAAAAPIELEEKPKLKDFPKTVRRQLSNDILMFRTASCVFHLLPIAGLYTFLPKYLETQFRLATYDANLIAAFCGILVMGIGIVISGLFILKRKPTAKGVAAWIAFTALVYSAGMVILMFIGCSMNDFAGYKASDGNSPAIIEPVCNAALNCTCDKENFAPICADGKMYISACHAGCSSSSLRASDNRTLYSDCACIPDVAEAVNGYCDNNCKNFIYFILIFAICVFMHSTSEVGSMLLVMRCTHPKDKAMAMGVIQSAIGLFGNVPCPIIYGAVVDSACLIWKSVCGKHGACSLYDADTFRQYFLGITAGIMFLAFLMDLVVWRKAHRIDIAPEDHLDAAGPAQASRSLDVSESKQPIAPAPDTTV